MVGRPSSSSPTASSISRCKTSWKAADGDCIECELGEPQSEYICLPSPHMNAVAGEFESYDLVGTDAEHAVLCKRKSQHWTCPCEEG
eukprot:5454092-Amphidinium_carterae.1